MDLASSKVKQMELSARIIRADGTIEELGTIQYWHKNPLKRIIWRIKQWLLY
jgi:hypothetical protein